MESTSIEYMLERECSLQKVGGNLDSKSYGVALPQGSALRSLMSSAIIKLNEEGEILGLKEKWWKRMRGGGQCAHADDASTTVNALNLSNVGGIFIVLLGGIALGAVIAIAEYFWAKREIVKMGQK